MAQQQINLYNTSLETLFSQLKARFPSFEYNYNRHLITWEDSSQNLLGTIRLPLNLTLDNELIISGDETINLYLTIESGNAAICILKGKTNIYHTTFSSYMVRKKQGYSQIKYLNKKGKSRAGARIRLTSTIEFFEEINTTLNDLFIKYDINRIALSCSPTLTSYLYKSKIECPFNKKDERLYKIPLHIQQSNYTNLSNVIKKLMAPILFYDDKDAMRIALIMDDV